MRADPPTYKCDAPGCKSYVILALDEPCHGTALAVRGWKCVSPTVDTKETHYCPAHGPISTKTE